jgi:succinyl-diaminopimelate desuccinylase
VRRLGLEPKILISAGSDDQRFVVHRAGIANSLVYGPGTTGLSHISDERISVEDLVLGTQGLALILADLLEAS